jgi:hypothetical protein
MDEKYKQILRRAVVIAYFRGGDMSTEDGSFAVTDLDSMINLQSEIQEAFGIESNEYGEILRMIDKL